MIGAILPPVVAYAEAFEDPPDVVLFPEEEALLVNAVDVRRREFATTRMCARRALALLGQPATPLLPGLRGSPQWPDSVVGSMTHCSGYRAAAVASSLRMIAIGIDAEPHTPLPDGVLGAIARTEELVWIAALHIRQPEVEWDRLLFSMKESVYKAWFPLTGRWLDFDGASVTVEPELKRFTARLTVSGPRVAGHVLEVFSGRWLIADGLLLTAIALPARSSARGGPAIPVGW